MPKTGSMGDLATHREEREASGSPRPRMNRPPRDPALSVLHENPNLVCISDRVDDLDLFPFEGCEGLLAQVLDSITRGNSVLLVGEPGVGRRTLSLGLARTLARLRETADPANDIYSRIVYSLSLGKSFWNRPPAEDVTDIQENIREVFRLVEAAGPEKIVLCIDDVDVLSFVDELVDTRMRDLPDGGRSSSHDGQLSAGASTENMLRFLLFNKKVLCLCTCIRAAYRRLVASDTYYDEKFTKSFRVLHMQEPSATDTLRVLRAHRRRIEHEVGAIVLDEAVRAAVAYSKRYMTHRATPAKALDLLYEASVAAASASSLDNGEGRERHQADRIYFRRSALSVRSRSIPMVRRRFVDELVTRWCGFSGRQLDTCLLREGLEPHAS